MTNLAVQQGQWIQEKGIQGQRSNSSLELRCRSIDTPMPSNNSTYVLEQQLDQYLSFLNSNYKNPDVAETIISTIRMNYQGMVMIKKPNSNEFVFAPMFKVLIDSNEPRQQTTKYRILYNNEITDYKQPDVSCLTFNQDRNY